MTIIYECFIYIIIEEGDDGNLDVLTPEQRSHNMQKISSKNTKPEIILRKALWHMGVRYRKNWKKLPGCPDIALTRQKIAIFVDGDFWHAKGHQDNPGEQVKSNRNYWVPKLRRNVERDREVNDELTEEGWLVLRYWDSDIKKHLPSVLADIKKYL